MIKKEKAIVKLVEVSYENGLNTGRWDCEELRDESVNRYLRKMKEFADELGIEYDEVLSNYMENVDELEYMTEDRMGFSIYELVSEYLINLIMGD